MVVSPPSYPTPTSPTAHPALLGREGVDLVLSSNGVHERSMEQDGKNTVKEEVKEEQEEDVERRSGEGKLVFMRNKSTNSCWCGRLWRDSMLIRVLFFLDLLF